MSGWLKKSLQSLGGGSKSSSTDEISEKQISASAAVTDINPVRWLQPSDLTWQCANNGTSESMNFYIHLNDGAGFLMLQLAHSSLALSPIVICTAQFTDGKGEKVALTRNLSGSDLTLDPSTKCSFHIKQRAVVFEQKQQDLPGYRVMIDFDGGNRCEIEFNGTEQACQVGESGSFSVSKIGEANYKFCPFGTVSGSLVFQGGNRRIKLDGIAMAAKNNQSTKPHVLGMNWEFVNFAHHSTQTLFCLVQMTSVDRSTALMALLVQQGKLVGVTVDGQVEMHGTMLDEHTKYQIVSSVTYSSQGNQSNNEQKQFSAVLSLGKCQPFWNRTDILGELPLLIRKVIQAFMTKPFCYMWWEPVCANINLGDSTQQQLNGYLYHETTLLKQ